MTRRRKIVLVIAVILLAPLLVLGLGTAAAFTWFASMDKTNGSIVSSGRTRPYLLYVPKSYDASKPTPLIVSLHGAAGWPALQMQMSRWNDVADKYGFIVVYPAGSDLRGRSEGRGPKVWAMGPHSIEADTRYISELIDKLESEYNIDRTRIYGDGVSNGGAMSFVLACRMSDRFAAVGAVAAAQTLSADWCKDPRPVPMVAVHGTADPIVPYMGGKSHDPFNPAIFPNVPEWTAAWAKRNGCTAEPISSQVTTSIRSLSYGNCSSNADVMLYTVEGGGHAWPGGKPLPEWWVGKTNNEIAASELLWQFYSQHTLAKR